jgi:hypothetical protein
MLYPGVLHLTPSYDVASVMCRAPSLGEGVVSVAPSMTTADRRYMFVASLTNCHGEKSEAQLTTSRLRGMIPGVFPSSGSTDYATDYSAALSIAMEVGSGRYCSPVSVRYCWPGLGRCCLSRQKMLCEKRRCSRFSMRLMTW